MKVNFIGEDRKNKLKRKKREKIFMKSVVLGSILLLIIGVSIEISIENLNRKLEGERKSIAGITVGIRETIEKRGRNSDLSLEEIADILEKQDDVSNVLELLENSLMIKSIEIEKIGYLDGELEITGVASSELEEVYKLVEELKFTLDSVNLEYAKRRDDGKIDFLIEGE